MNHYNGYYDDKFQFWSPEMEGGESSDGSLRQDEEVMLAASHPKKRAGRKKFQETRHPVYRGVRQRSSGKWVSEVREPYKQSRIWLGTFPTPEMAARAHDVAVLALRGRSACLNFADSSWRSPAPATLDPNDIRKAAVEAAEAFRPAESGGDVTVAVPEDEGYVDEEAELDMPALLDNMAEGLMLPPPPSSYGGGDGYYGDDVEYGGEVSLWNYSL